MGIFSKIIGSIIGWIAISWVRKTTALCCATSTSWVERLVMKIGGMLVGTYLTKKVADHWMARGRDTKKQIDKELEKSQKKKA